MNYIIDTFSRCVILIALVVSLSGADITPRQAAVIRDVIANAQVLANDGKTKNAVANLMAVRKSIAPYQSVEIEVMLGKLALKAGAVEEAWGFLEPYADVTDAYQGSWASAYFAAAETLRAKDEKAKALALYDWVAQNARGESLVFAAIGCGEVLSDLNLNDRAIEALKFAQREARRSLDNQYNDYDDLFKRIGRLLKIANHQRDVVRYGEDFLLFRDAEHLLRERRNASAAESKYKEIRKRFPHGPYTPAACVGEAICMRMQGRWKEGEKALLDFIQVDPMGYYRGEALLEIARLRLECAVDPTGAESSFNELDKWIEHTRELDESLDKETIREAALPLVAPPKTKRVKTDDGRLVPVKIKPGQLVNERTCAWYLNDLAERAIKFKGLLLLARGKNEEALKQFNKLATLDNIYRLDVTDPENPNDLDRLRWGAEHGYLFAFPNELRLFNSKQKLAIWLADFYFVTEEFGRAQKMYNRLIEGEFGRLQQNEYPRLGLATVLGLVGKREEAMEQYEHIMNSGRKGFTWCRATFGAAALLLTSRKAEDIERAYALFHELDQQGFQNDWVYHARIYLASEYLSRDDVKSAEAIFSRIPKQASEWRELVDYIKNQSQSK